jgi:tRNA wybutosine-synthesizing protein 2
VARIGPVARVRARARSELGGEVAARVPRGYQRMGDVLLVHLPTELAPHYERLGSYYAEATGTRTVLRYAGPARGEYREPSADRIFGTDTETELVEHGTVYRFDASRLLFARGNKTERVRLGRQVRPGEQIIDLFAGIGYFAIPLARADPTVRVTAVEANPLSFRYLSENIQRNEVASQVRPVLGDNRAVELATGAADRVLLGYLPSSLPWLGRALELLRPEGGRLHVHLVVGAKDGLLEAESRVRAALASNGVEPFQIASRKVKSYGPGRIHAVVDVRASPGSRGPNGPGLSRPAREGPGAAALGP